MKEEKFSIKYEGSALANHEMNVKDLAPALLAAGELFEEINAILNNERARVNVNIKATKEGSVEIYLGIAQSVLEKTRDIFSGDTSTAIANASALYLIVFGGKDGYFGLVNLIKWVKNRKIKSVVTLETGDFKIQLEDGEAKVFKSQEIDLFRSISIRKKVETIIKAPLSKEGIDSVKISNKETSTEINKSEIEYFSTPEVEEEVIDEREIETNLTIMNISFQDGGKWKFSDGNSVFFADIEDAAFLANVEQNKAAFSKDDILQTTLKRKQFIINGEMKTEYIVKKVNKHRSAAVQIQLPFSDAE